MKILLSDADIEENRKERHYTRQRSLQKADEYRALPAL